MTHPQAPRQELLSLRAAARLVEQPKEYLQELAAVGRLAIFMTGSPDAPKWKVSRAGLIEARLLPPDRSAEMIDLVDLAKGQSERIEALEDQRFQLGAQLGAALERIASLEVRLIASDPSSAFADQTISLPAYARTRKSPMREAVELLGEASLRRSSGLSARFGINRLRLSQRVSDETR
jgi:hypothetical protein